MTNGKQNSMIVSGDTQQTLANLEQYMGAAQCVATDQDEGHQGIALMLSNARSTIKWLRSQPSNDTLKK